MNPISIRPFIGAKDFELSRRFYHAWGFAEIQLSADLSVFKLGNTAFYLQDAFVEEWVNNTMVFLEVQNVEAAFEHLVSLDLPGQFPGVRVLPIRYQDWGSECFVHDPSGILWHVGVFGE